LSRHKGTGYWCKKVRGRVHYYGKVADDPKGVAALEQWLDQKDDLLAGREPRTKSEGLTVAELCNQFLAHKEALRDNGELNPRTFWDYYATCAGVVKAFGGNRAVVDLVPDDFRKLRATLAKRRKAVALGNEIQRVRSVFKFAFDDGLILAPVRFGQAFAKPKKEVVTKERNAHRMEHGYRMFEAADIRQILAASGQPLKVMVLLAANCGFGQTDCSSLPVRAVDVEAGWVDYPRPKTGIARRIPLWPETVAAIREWLPQRPKAKDPGDAKLLFLTCCGARWVKLNATGAPCDALGQEFGKVIRKLGLKRSRRAFYGLRHGFETVAGETADQVAVDAIMGHVPSGMAGVYRERIGDDRLRRVVEHVRRWLFGQTTDDPTGPRSTLRISDPSDPPPQGERGTAGPQGAQGSQTGQRTLTEGGTGAVAWLYAG
jgi:integrase